MNGVQASLSPQMDLAPTEMFDIEDHQGSDISASLKAGLPTLGSELHLCLQTGPSWAVGGLPMALPCLLALPSQPPPCRAYSRLQGISD